MCLSYRRKWQQYFRHCGVATGVDLKSLMTTTRKYEKENTGIGLKFFLKHCPLNYDAISQINLQNPHQLNKTPLKCMDRNCTLLT